MAEKKFWYSSDYSTENLPLYAGDDTLEFGVNVFNSLYTVFSIIIPSASSPIDEETKYTISGSSGNDKLVIKEATLLKGTYTDFNDPFNEYAYSTDYDMRGGTNTITVNSKAYLAMGNLSNIDTLTLKGGSADDARTQAVFNNISVYSGKAAIKLGNYTYFSAVNINNIDSRSNISFSAGNNSTVELGNFYTVRDMTIGKKSSLQAIGVISGIGTGKFSVGNDSLVFKSKSGETYENIAGIEGFATISLGKNSNIYANTLDCSKKITIGNDATISTEKIKANSIIAGSKCTVDAKEIVLWDNKAVLTTGKASVWNVTENISGINTLTVTAAGNYEFNADKTKYEQTHTVFNVGDGILCNDGKVKIVFGNYSVANIENGIKESPLGSELTMTVGTNAKVNITKTVTFPGGTSMNVRGEINSLASLTVSNGVDYKTYTVTGGVRKADAEKAVGTTVLTAGNVYATNKNNTYKIGNKASVIFTQINMGAGNDTISIGKTSQFGATELKMGPGKKDTITIGSGSSLSATTISGINKLTLAAGKADNPKTAEDDTIWTKLTVSESVSGQDDTADVLTFGNYSDVILGDVNFGDLADTRKNAKLKDKLAIGKNAIVEIEGDITGLEIVTIEKDTDIFGSESALASILTAKQNKGSKIDDSVTFTALDDAPDTVNDEDVTTYDVGKTAWLGAAWDDTVDFFDVSGPCKITMSNEDALQVTITTWTEEVGGAWSESDPIAWNNDIGGFKINSACRVKVELAASAVAKEDGMASYTIAALA